MSELKAEYTRLRAEIKALTAQRDRIAARLKDAARDGVAPEGVTVSTVTTIQCADLAGLLGWLEAEGIECPWLVEVLSLDTKAFLSHLDTAGITPRQTDDMKVWFALRTTERLSVR